MICTRCEQGDIAKARIRKTGQEIYVCQECEALWFSVKEIGVLPFLDFGMEMIKIGLQPIWDELEI